MNWGNYNDLGTEYWSIDLLPTIQVVRELSTGDTVLVFAWLCWWFALEV